MFKEYFKMAVRNLRTRPLRSWLTILGIVIGVFLITSLLSLSEGLKGTIMKQLNMIGKDLIIVMPGEVTDFVTAFAGGLELTEEDMEVIKRTDGVKVVIPIVYKAEVVRYKGDSKTIIISGTDWKNAGDIYREDFGWSLTEGRWPVPGKREVIVGSMIPEEVFKKIQIGSKVIIKGRDYELAGIMQSVCQKSDDSLMHLDLDIFREITAERRGAKEAIVKIEPDFSAEEVAEKIKANLFETRKRKKGEELMPFSVLTSEKITGIVNNIMGVVQVAVFSFASIAILVGGIGIMNTMYTSVHERTKEIGILKAVGAKNKTITMIFLIESGIIGVIGGLGGVFPGLALAKLIEVIGQVHPVFYLEASFSPYIVLFSLGFSFVIGCISGYFPAKRASKLKPVEALGKYE